VEEGDLEFMEVKSPLIVEQKQKKKKKTKVFAPAIKQAFIRDDGSADSLHHEVSYHIPKSSFYNKHKVEILNRHHPCVLSDVFDYGSYNEHPLCAAFRSIAEAHVISQIRYDMAAHNLYSGKICDVGGSVNRHFNNKKRKFIHSCVPTFEAKDLMRKFALKGTNYCHHRWEDCNCHNFSASMSVHSLYYVEPEDILRKLLEQEIPVHYAVIHRYFNTVGELMDGEMSYSCSNGKVRVVAKGNHQPYIHSDMQWLNEESYVSNNGTLVWELERRFEDVYVYRFNATASLIAKKDVLEVEKEGFDKAPYEDAIKLSLRLGRPINKKSRESFLDRLTRQGIARGLDHETLIRLGDEYYMNLKPVLSIPSWKTRFNAVFHNRALEFVLPSAPWAWLTLLLSVIFATGLYCVSNDVDLDYRATLVLCLALPLVVLIKKFTQLGSECVMHTDLPLSLKDNLKWRVKLFDYCAKDCELRELSERKVIKFKHPVIDECDCVPGLRAYPMVYNPDFVPMIPRRCDHNYYATIRHKVLAETKEDVDFNLTLPKELIEVAKLIDIVPLSWEEWVSRFPPAKEARLRREMEELRDECFTDETWNASKLFLKAEFYPEVKPPRPIHSSNVVLNFSVGRWLIPIGEQMPSLLPDWIEFPVHADSLEIGEFYNNQKTNARLATSDFSQYDSTQRAEALLMIVEFFRLCGVPENVCKLMELDTSSIRVSTRKGFSYTCRGLRLSGRSETLLGNTVLTLAIFLHVARPYLKAILVKGDDAVLFLKPDSPASVTDIIREDVDALGFITKIHESDEYDTEFCSSYFLPCLHDDRETFCLVPKPGKMLAKTFWCKNTQFNEEQVKDQFVGILKGMRHTLALVPGVNRVFEHPLYLNRFERVDMYRQAYNEYTDSEVDVCDATWLWMCTKYDVSVEQLLELGQEMNSHSFPIRVTSIAAYRMMETDWGVQNPSELLVEEEIVEKDHGSDMPTIATFVLLEEIARYAFPVMFSIMAGATEYWCTGNVMNLIMHLLLGILNVQGLHWLAILVHLCYNLKSAALNRLSLFHTVISSKFNYLIEKRKMVKQKTRRRRRRSRKKKSGLNSKVRQVSMLIADPCNSDLGDGIYPMNEGIVQGFQTRLEIPADNDYTCGFVLWDPAYVSDIQNHFNCILFTTPSATTPIINSTANPCGTGSDTTDVEGMSLQVGGGPWAGDSAICAGTRTHAACLQLFYYGRMDETAGEIGFVENMPAELLLGSGSGDNLTVQELMQYCTKTQRVSLDGSEVTWRPRDGCQYFRDQQEGPYVLGVPTSTYTAISERADLFGPRLCGFVLRDVGDISNFSFVFRQIIEWRPRAATGLLGVVPRTVNPEGIMERALDYLDKNYPGWSTTLYKASSVVANIAKAAYSGNF
jgi:hypothetical protein